MYRKSETEAYRVSQTVSIRFLARKSASHPRTILETMASTRRPMTPRFLVLLLGLLHGFRSSAGASNHRAPRSSHARSLPSLITREHVERRRTESRNLVSRGKPTGGGKYPFLAVVDWTDFDHGVLDPRVRGTALAANLDDCCCRRSRLNFLPPLPRIGRNLRIFGAMV
jgi:hypothetical protein